MHRWRLLPNGYKWDMQRLERRESFHETQYPASPPESEEDLDMLHDIEVLARSLVEARAIHALRV